MGTGNNYSAPDSVLECQTQAIANHDPNAQCTAADDFFETALALDLNDGHIRWSKRLQDYDVWTVPCIVAGFGTCPSPAGPDYDLGGSGPNAFTGKPLWQTADPTVGAIDMGSVSVANGVMYAGSQSGSMYALDAADGKVLWSFASGGTVLDGPAIVEGVIYWGSGYNNPGTPNNQLYAFSIPPGTH